MNIPTTNPGASVDAPTVSLFRFARRGRRATDERS